MQDGEVFKSALRSTDECLSLEQLEAVAGGTQDHPHLAQCPRCQAELALLKSFESGTPIAGEGAAVAWISSQLERRVENTKRTKRGSDLRLRDGGGTPQASWIRRLFTTGRLRVLVPVAAAVAIAAGILWLHSPKEPDLRADAGNHPTVFRSDEMRVVGPIGDVAQPPQQIKWQPIGGAVLYKLVLMEVDHSTIWSSDTQAISVAVPPDVRARMLPGKPILWQVTALSAQGSVLAASPVETFVYRDHPRAGESSPSPNNHR